jgi:hypothetical protein
MHFLPQGRDSSVGVVTRHELDGPGMESLWERDFPHPFSCALGTTQLPVQWVWFFAGGTTNGAWRWSPDTCIAQVKEGVVLYLYYPSGLSWPVIGWTLYLSSYFSDITGHCVSFLGVKHPFFGISPPPPPPPGVSWPALGWNLHHKKLAAYVFQRMISRYCLGKWSVIFTLAVVKYIEYIVWEQWRVFNLNKVVDIVTTVLETLIYFSILFRPPVGKAFILRMAVRIAISYSFAYILMATACSLKEFSFFPTRYIIFSIVVTGWPVNPSIAEGKNEWH